MLSATYSFAGESSRARIVGMSVDQHSAPSVTRATLALCLLTGAVYAFAAHGGVVGCSAFYHGVVFYVCFSWFVLRGMPGIAGLVAAVVLAICLPLPMYVLTSDQFSTAMMDQIQADQTKWILGIFNHERLGDHWWASELVPFSFITVVLVATMSISSFFKSP